jgi:hypothetical protein
MPRHIFQSQLRSKQVKNLLVLALLALSPVAFATSNQNHECQGGHNCNTYDIPPQSSQDQEQSQGQAQSQTATAVAGASASVESSNTNLNVNDNTNVANGGSAYAQGGVGLGVGGNQSQGQSSENNNSNSGNNAAQVTNVAVNTAASKTWRYSNNVSAIAPNIYSSSACTAGGLTGAASALGVGVSLGGAKQDPQCQIRENARILAGLNSDLAIEYLCKNPGVDIGTVLGAACIPPVVIDVPVVTDPPVVVPPIIITDDVKG